ncbi:MAG: hypothetical protein H7Y18_00695 [Clostridiaceae bacterium]|nr:hypothetical protein [Clostridiaceae bacterium]
MKIIITEYLTDWPGESSQIVKPFIFDLLLKNHLFIFLVTLANGNFEEVCIETDSEDTLKAIRNLLIGTGNVTKLQETSNTANRRLYREGYEIYTQGDLSMILLNPKPQPNLFNQEALDAYTLGFATAWSFDYVAEGQKLLSPKKNWFYYLAKWFRRV